VLLDKRDPISAPTKGAGTDSRAEFGKETITGPHQVAKMIARYGMQANQGRAQDTQALIRYAYRRLMYPHPYLRIKQQQLTSRD